jgi:hypothetical protein
MINLVIKVDDPTNEIQKLRELLAKTQEKLRLQEGKNMVLIDLINYKFQTAT